MAGSAVGGDRRHHLRPAEPHEAKELEELQDRSASHWDHPDGYFDRAGDARRVTESYVSDDSGFVLVDSDGCKLDFYGFTEDDDGLLPDRMFLDEITRGRSHPC
jgi:hypothetical protein